MKLEIEQAIVIRYVSYGLTVIFILVLALVFFSSNPNSKDGINNGLVSYDDSAQIQRSRLANDISSNKSMNEAYPDLDMTKDNASNKNSGTHVTANPPKIPENLVMNNNSTSEDSNQPNSVAVTQTYTMSNDADMTLLGKEIDEGYKVFKGSIYKFDHPNNAIILVMDDKSGLSAVNVTDNTKILINDTQIKFSDLRIGDKVTAEGYGLVTESNIEADKIVIHGFLQTAP